ncbi:hypothetical protein EC881467_4259, partial [Escherichia coli 88.1467]
MRQFESAQSAQLHHALGQRVARLRRD